MEKKEWIVIEKYANKFCCKCKLPKGHIYYDTPEKCDCDFHVMIRELKLL